MNGSEAQIGCQCQLECLDRMSEPGAEVILPPLVIRWRLQLSRQMNPRTKRAILMYSDRIASLFSRMTDKRNGARTAPRTPRDDLEAGDLVRVRSKEEIETTLNLWRQLRGCTFMEEMESYCGTTQRILRPVRRFVDERDNQYKKVRGLILLEGSMCQGTDKFGHCDRSCFYFWREEWLEKVD